MRVREVSNIDKVKSGKHLRMGLVARRGHEVIEETLLKLSVSPSDLWQGRRERHWRVNQSRMTVI